MSEPAKRTGKPPRERVDLRIAPDGLEIVRALAEREERSLSDMLRVLVMEALNARGLLASEKPARGLGTRDGEAIAARRKREARR